MKFNFFAGLFFAALVIAAPGVLAGSEAGLTFSRGTDGGSRQLTIQGARAESRLQLLDGVYPLGVVTADTLGRAIVPAALLAPGPHAIRAVEWGTGKQLGPLLRFGIPMRPAGSFHAADTFATGTRPGIAAVGDLEGKGFPDLIFSSEDKSQIMRLPNVNGVFGAAVPVTAISAPAGIAIGDLDGDGRNDLAIAMADGRVAILLNRGQGVFSPAQYFAAGTRPSSLVSADFNSDGIPDLAVANQAGNDVSILLGNGDGTFLPAVAVSAGAAPSSLVVADFNGDGVADLATADFGSNGVSLLLGDGKGSFRNAGAVATGNGPSTLLAADFNVDGSPDLAVFNRIDGTVAILLNGVAPGTGVGTFGVTSITPVAGCFTIGDVDGDGKPDLLMQTGTELQVRAGFGDGSFAGAYKAATLNASLILLLHDFSHSGRLDAAALDIGGTFSILPGTATVPEGTPQPIMPGSSLSDSASSAALINAANTVPSRRPEAFVTGNTASSLSFTAPSAVRFGGPITLTATILPLAGTGTVTFYYGNTAILGTVPVSGGHATLSTILLSSGSKTIRGYYSGDAIYLPSSYLATNVTSATSTPTTSFGLPVTYSTGGGVAKGPFGVALADFNGDGKVDMVTANFSGSLSVFLGNGNGTFQAATTIPTAGVPVSVATGDFNGDGKMDVAVANVTNVGVYTGNGDGTFQAPAFYSAGAQPYALAVADFNGDGKADLAVTNGTPGTPGTTVSLIFGIGNGAFQTPAVSYTVGAGPVFVAVADLNKDGLPDLVTANAGDASVSVLLGAGGGAFRPAARYAVGSTPTGLAIANINGDDVPDLAVANLEDKTVSFLAGVGDGTFLAQTVISTGANQAPVAVTVLDLNQDGKADLLIPDNAGTNVSVLFGIGNGTFQPPAAFPTGSQPGAVQVGDFDGDGVPDIAVPNFNNDTDPGSVSVLFGSVLRFMPIPPCRITDTRLGTGPFAGQRDFPISAGSCGIPPAAQAYSLNITVVPKEPLGYLTVWPAGRVQPLSSTLNSDGRIKSNAAIVPAGTNGSISAFASNATDLILDVDGYFVAASNPSALSFYPVTPCRIADTRKTNGALGGPFLAGGTTRALPISSGTCGIPPTALVYSLNLAAIPRQNQPLGYLTTWQTGQPQPLASTLNSATGIITANAAIVAAGAGGAINVFASNDTDLVVDVNGYFGPPGAGGLSFYTVQPCRVLDTRLSSGQPFSGILAVPFTASPCAPPPAAQAFVFNATAVPLAPLGYLTLWPQGIAQPVVSTLNSDDGKITANMAIVPSLNGIVNAFASGQTHLVLDLFGYFAR